jgi:hypothetical protein
MGFDATLPLPQGCRITWPAVKFRDEEKTVYDENLAFERRRIPPTRTEDRGHRLLALLYPLAASISLKPVNFSSATCQYGLQVRSSNSVPRIGLADRNFGLPYRKGQASRRVDQGLDGLMSL